MFLPKFCLQNVILGFLNYNALEVFIRINMVCKLTDILEKALKDTFAHL